MIAPQRQHLRNRILLLVSSLTLGISLVFSFYTIAFTYAVEDAFFAAHLEEEAARLLEQRDRSGSWPSPRDAGVVVHTTQRTLPSQVRELLGRANVRAPSPGGRGTG